MCKSLFLKFQSDASNFIKKKDSGTDVLCQFFNISKNTFFTEHPWASRDFCRAWAPASHMKGVIRCPLESHLITEDILVVSYKPVS